MQGQTQYGGTTGLLRLPTGEQVDLRFYGEYSYQLTGGGSPMQALQVAQQLGPRVSEAAKQLLAERLMSGQIQLVHLAQWAPHLGAELVQRVDAASLGAQLTQITLNIQDPAAPGAAAGAPGAPGMAPGAPGMGPGQMPPTPMQAAGNALAQQAEDRLDPRNYEVHAKLNVGGFKVNLNSKDGLDTDGLKKQAKDKVMSKVWGCVIGAVILLLILGGVVFVYFFYIKPEVDAGLARQANPSAEAPQAAPPAAGDVEEASWDGKSTFTCSGNAKQKLSKVSATLKSGSGIKASGNCYLELEDVKVDAPIALDVSGNAFVKVKGGELKGKTAAIKTLGPVKVELEGVKVTGKKQTLGAGTITEK